MAMKSITININGTPKTHEVEDRLLLVHFIRDNCALTGTHIGCDSTHCGACTVLLDGTAYQQSVKREKQWRVFTETYCTKTSENIKKF